jgi:DNA-binding transcriptional ArsR family regulator
MRSGEYKAVSVDAFAVLSEPTRRRILDLLRTSECSVGELATALGASQPSTSKHLKVLRDARFISCRIDAQRRVYRLETVPLQVVDAWLAPYRALWERHLDALERHLDARVAGTPSGSTPDRPPEEPS